MGWRTTPDGQGVPRGTSSCRPGMRPPAPVMDHAMAHRGDGRDCREVTRGCPPYKSIRGLSQYPGRDSRTWRR
jgi:hypothetical protein